MSQRCCKSLVEATHSIFLVDVPKVVIVTIVEIVAIAEIVVIVVMANF